MYEGVETFPGFLNASYFYAKGFSLPVDLLTSREKHSTFASKMDNCTQVK